VPGPEVGTPGNKSRLRPKASDSEPSAGAQIDTTTANGRLAFVIFAAFTEFERELIAERTRAGLAAARARGRQPARAGTWADARVR